MAVAAMGPVENHSRGEPYAAEIRAWDVRLLDIWDRRALEVLAARQYERGKQDQGSVGLHAGTLPRSPGLEKGISVCISSVPSRPAG